MRIGVIVGSLSSTSLNRKVEGALHHLAPEGVELVDISILDLPLYSPDHDSAYPAVASAFKEGIAAADGVIIITPEYSRSIPGSLKNALDWAARPGGTNPLNGKPVAIAGASGGPIGTAMAQQHLRNILAHFNANTMGQPETFLSANSASFGPDGAAVDEALASRLTRFITAVVEHVEKNAS